MPIVHLTDRALIDVTGPDAETFLQNIITTDLASLPAGEARQGALLSPQGKILFAFLISRLPGGFRMDTQADAADDFVKRLTLYRLRAKAEITKQDQAVVAVAWDSDSGASQTDSSSSDSDSGALRDSRFPVAIQRHHDVVPAADASVEDWHRLRVAHGIAEMGPDFAAGDAFPHDVLLDQTNGVGMRKGCYVGQEVVSRMHHRGTARRRVLLVTGKADLPAPGTPVTAGGRPIGTLGSVAQERGLAILRIDRVKDAMDAGTPLLAGEVELSASIPAWATFGFPDTSAGAEAD